MAHYTKYKMDEETLGTMIMACREEIAEGGYTDIGKEKWNREIDFILKGKDLKEKWDRLIASNIFTFTFGEWVGVDDDILSVDGVCYGKGKPNSYFPIFGE